MSPHQILLLTFFFLPTIVIGQTNVCVLWTSQANTNVRLGRHVSVPTIEECQAACINKSECTGIDWNLSQSWHCWLTGPWSGRRTNDTAYGVTHFELNRKCLEPVRAWWTVYKNWRRRGAVRALADQLSVTLEQCQQQCINNSSCVAVTFDGNDPHSNNHCYLNFNQTAQGLSLFGTDLYELTRCGDDASKRILGSVKTAPSITNTRPSSGSSTATTVTATAATTTATTTSAAAVTATVETAPVVLSSDCNCVNMMPVIILATLLGLATVLILAMIVYYAVCLRSRLQETAGRSRQASVNQADLYLDVMVSPMYEEINMSSSAQQPPVYDRPRTG